MKKQVPANSILREITANDRQVGGNHYKKAGRVEHWDIVVQWDLDYFQGIITKYVMRWKAKGGIVDLEKGLHSLEKYIEVARAGQVPGGGQVKVTRRRKGR